MIKCTCHADTFIKLNSSSELLKEHAAYCITNAPKNTNVIDRIDLKIKSSQLSLLIRSMEKVVPKDEMELIDKSELLKRFRELNERT